MRHFLWLALFFVLTSASGEEIRTWSAGEFTERGVFLSYKDDTVIIQQENGDEIEVAFSSLSEKDQTYVTSRESDKKSPFRKKQPADLPQLTNSIGMKLTLIPAGEFTMGDPPTEGRDTTHRVKLTKPFFLGNYEVTVSQWDEVFGTSRGDDSQPEKESAKVLVDWSNAILFCLQLSQLPSEIAARRIYRLPNEAEWEHACRAGTETRFSFGDDEKKLCDYAGASQQNRKAGGDAMVGQHKANPWGLYDMHGNVAEWCRDWSAEYQGDAVDPTGPVRGTVKVVRGGSRMSSPKTARSAARDSADPSERHRHIGFRVAMDLYESADEYSSASAGQEGALKALTLYVMKRIRAEELVAEARFRLQNAAGRRDEESLQEIRQLLLAVTASDDLDDAQRKKLSFEITQQIKSLEFHLNLK